MTEVLPLLDLHGLSSGDFVPALGQFLGSTKGLSSSSSGPAHASNAASWSNGRTNQETTLKPRDTPIRRS